MELSTPVPASRPGGGHGPGHVSTPVPSIQAAAVTTAPAPSDAAEPAPAGKAAPLAQPHAGTRGASATSAPAPTAFAPHSSSALVITAAAPGQRVYARHTDLVVIGMVSQGAEVIADGNACTALRGVMAGARGDATARIFTTHLDAELLAVAGVYRVVEDKLDRSHNQPALIRLDGDTLRIEALKA